MHRKALEAWSAYRWPQFASYMLIIKKCCFKFVKENVHEGILKKLVYVMLRYNQMET